MVRLPTMFTLHPPTLLLMLLVGFAVLNVQLWLAQRASLPKLGLRAVSLSAWCYLGGFALVSLQDVLPLWLSEVVGSGLIFMGAASFTHAVYQYTLNRGLPTSYRALLAVSVPTLLTSLALAPAQRSTLLSWMLAALLAPSTWVALRHGWRSEASFRLVGCTLALSLLGLLWRGAYALMRPEAFGALVQTGLLTGLTLALAFVGLAAAGTGFVLACFERVARQMKELASTDRLTGCSNQVTTHALLEHALERGRREGQPVSFAMLDLDHFKRVNDRHGHAVGDEVLRAFAACVRERLRGSDAFGRLGGEEFGLVLPATDERGARAVAEQLRQAVAALDLRGDGGQVFHVTVSIGVAVALPDQGYSPDQLIQLADKALYRAKSRGRNQVVVADAWLLNSTLSAAME